MHPDDDHIHAYEPYRGPDRRTTTRATAENQDDIKGTLEGLSADVSWIKKGLAWGMGISGSLLTIAMGLTITYTVSTHNDIDKLQEQMAKFDTLAKSHHNANGCHFLDTQKRDGTDAKTAK